MSIPVSLLQIPEIPMKHILEYCDFPSILILRKVCHDLRNFIDDTKPASRLKKIYVATDPESISFTLKSTTFHQNENVISIEYVKNEKGCLVKCEKEENVKETLLEDNHFVTACEKDGIVKKTIMENDDFVTVFFKDFNIVLRHQKTVLEDFKISFVLPDSTVKKSVMENVNKSLKSMSHPLKVKSFSMDVYDHNEILRVLPYIDPKTLKEIQIYEFPSRRHSMLNLDEIGQLEQWKQADELIISGFRSQNLSQNLEHFSKIDFRFRPFNTEELILLKDIFLFYPTLHSMEIILSCINTAIIGPTYTDIDEVLIEAFGHPFLNSNENRTWFFRIPDTIQFLRIKRSRHSIVFNRIEQSDVPQDAVILN